MRILHISKYYYPYIGGVENICKYLVEGCSSSEIAVVCFNEDNKNVVDEVEGHKVYRVATQLVIARQALSFSYRKVLKRAIREFQPDIIQFHWANPFPAAILLSVIPKNVKLMVFWHMDIIKQKYIYPLIKPIEQKLLKRADLITVTSPQYKDYSLPLQKFKNKIRIVPNAIDETKLALVAEDEECIKAIKETYNNRKIVFFVGRHIQYKGLQYLLQAEKFVKSDCVFVIAGNGPLTEELKKSTISERVYFVGRLTDDELRRYHYAASVFAFPSITKNEAFGVALAEAMYCYTPAVTFTIEGSGVNWVSLNGETGIEVPNGDVIAYASAIDTLLENDALANQYANAAHERVKSKFLIKNMVSEMESCYKLVCSIGETTI